MYIISNWVYGPDARSSGGNTSSNPQVSVLLSRPASNGMEKIDLYICCICSRGGLGIKHSKLRKFAVIAMECFLFATVDRGSITTGMHRWSMMIYGNQQVEWLASIMVISIGMEHLSVRHIHRYGTPIFYDILLYFSGIALSYCGTTNTLPHAHICAHTDKTVV